MGSDGLCPAGLQGGSEGLHRHPGAHAAHGGGLLGHGVAGEEQHHRHGDQTEGEQRGEQKTESTEATTSVRPF